MCRFLNVYINLKILRIKCYVAYKIIHIYKKQKINIEINSGTAAND